MCGRLACSLCPEDVQISCTYSNANGKSKEPKWLDNTGYTYKPFYNGPPTTTVPVLIHRAHAPELSEITDSPDYCIGAMKWGLTTEYMVDPKTILHTHNARIETVQKSHMYKPVLMSGGRCVVVAEGFYEWQTTKGQTDKQPYFIYQNPQREETQRDDAKYLMKMAGLFARVNTESGPKYSCTIFTTESDGSLSWLHHRMPVILNTQKEVDDWLNYKGVGYILALETIGKKFQEKSDESHALKYYKVDRKFVNKSTCNEAKCMAEISVKPAAAGLDGWLNSTGKSVGCFRSKPGCTKQKSVKRVGTLDAWLSPKKKL